MSDAGSEITGRLESHRQLNPRHESNFEDSSAWAGAETGCENAPNNDPTPVARYELKSLGKSTIGWGHITRET